MADATIDSEQIYLTPGRWGTPDKTIVLQDGVTGALHHNVVAPFFPLGTVIQVWNNGTTAGVDGFSEFVYVQYIVGSGPTCAAKQLLVPDAVGTGPYVLTNDPDDCIVNSGCERAAVAISVVTTAYYGWAWCGGVVPEAEVSGLGGTYATDDSVLAGSAICEHNLTADAMGFAATDGVLDVPIGFALAEDA